MPDLSSVKSSTLPKDRKPDGCLCLFHHTRTAPSIKGGVSPGAQRILDQGRGEPFGGGIVDKQR